VHICKATDRALCQAEPSNAGHLFPSSTVAGYQAGHRGPCPVALLVRRIRLTDQWIRGTFGDLYKERKRKNGPDGCLWRGEAGCLREGGPGSVRKHSKGSAPSFSSACGRVYRHFASLEYGAHVRMHVLPNPSGHGFA
jgi:hypothetical protein